jgi:hypothetical protein
VALRGRDHRSVRPVVFAVLAQLSGFQKSWRSAGSPWTMSRLALGPALCSRFESAHSPRTPAPQSILEGRRDLRPGSRELGLSLPGGRLRWRDYRRHVVAEAGSDCCKALLAACVIREQWDPATRHQR